MPLREIDRPNTIATPIYITEIAEADAWNPVLRHVIAELLHVLPPIDIGIDQVFRTIRWSTSGAIEERQVVRVHRKRLHRYERNQYHRYPRPTAQRKSRDHE